MKGVLLVWSESMELFNPEKGGGSLLDIGSSLSAGSVSLSSDGSRVAPFLSSRLVKIYYLP